MEASVVLEKKSRKGKDTISIIEGKAVLHHKYTYVGQGITFDMLYDAGVKPAKGFEMHFSLKELKEEKK